MSINRPSIVEREDSPLFNLILVGIAGIRRAMQPSKTNSELIADALTALASVRTKDAQFTEALAAASLSIIKCLPLALGAGQTHSMARGKRMGGGFKLTRDTAIRFKQMLREGRRPSEIRQTLGISAGSIHNYRRRLENWDEVNGPWPPPGPNEDGQTVLEPR